MLFEIPTIEACILCQKFLTQENADAYTQSFVDSISTVSWPRRGSGYKWLVHNHYIVKKIINYSNIFSFVLDLAIFSHCGYLLTEKL